MRKVKIEPIFYIFIAMAFMLIPARLVIGWLIAVTVHELFHFLALILCNVEINNIIISTTGVKMEIGDLHGFREAICALAGPLGGLSLVLLRRWLPCAAILGSIHSCINLLPIFYLDGGRALHCILNLLFGIHTSDYVHLIISYAVTILLALSVAYYFLQSNFVVGSFWVACILFTNKTMRKFPCKPIKQIVQ